MYLTTYRNTVIKSTSFGIFIHRGELSVLHLDGSALKTHSTENGAMGPRHPPSLASHFIICCNRAQPQP